MPAQTDESNDAREMRAFTLELRRPSQDPVYLTLPINPQSLTITHPSRNAAQQTLAGQYVEAWGPGLPSITLEGHTGYAPRTPIEGVEEIDGYQAFRALLDMLKLYDEATKRQLNVVVKPGSELAQLFLHYWEEDEHWEVVPTGSDALRRSRSADAPLLFRYQLSLVAVAPATVSGDLAMLLGLPSLDNLLGDLTKDWGQVGAFLGKVGGAASSAAKAAKGYADKAKAMMAQVKKTVQTGTKFVNALVAPIRALVKEGRALLAQLSSVMRSVAAFGGTLNRAEAAVGIRALRCYNNTWASMQAWFKKFASPLTGAWDASRRNFTRC